jgi:hypothetical protein
MFPLFLFNIIVIIGCVDNGYKRLLTDRKRLKFAVDRVGIELSIDRV